MLKNGDDNKMSVWGLIKGEKTIYQRAIDAYDAYQFIIK